MRQEEHEAYKLAVADLSQGLEGVRMALKVLREYYAKEESLMQKGKDFDAFMQQPEPPTYHKKAEGSATGIIGMLEVAESDFARNLAEEEATEAAAAEEYEKTTQENKITKATKEQDVKYKTAAAEEYEKTTQENKI